MRVRLSPLARRDLDSIWAFAVERWGQSVAERYARDFAAAFDSLSANPHQGLDVAFVRPGYRRLPVRSHSIYYRVEIDMIVVIRILHQRQDVATQLP